jgi:hypothetical protein
MWANRLSTSNGPWQQAIAMSLHSLGPLPGGGKDFGSLVACGTTTMKRPLDGSGGFLKILLSGRSLPQIAVNAAATYGMLAGQSANGERESLSLWKELIRELRRLQVFVDAGTAKNYGLSIGARLDVLLLPAAGRDGHRLAFRPINLAQAIKIFWATTIATGGALRPCKQCGEFFEAGGESRRADAKFCSDDCRHRFNNDRKRASAR